MLICRCGNVNWARRGTCNMCNAPKIGEVEERTGYGGGFNERTGVEYIQREESDDEYDEFGRRKKKFRSKVPVMLDLCSITIVQYNSILTDYMLQLYMEAMLYSEFII